MAYRTLPREVLTRYPVDAASASLTPSLKVSTWMKAYEPTFCPTLPDV
jgi:hypothetical protein